MVMDTFNDLYMANAVNVDFTIIRRQAVSRTILLGATNVNSATWARGLNVTITRVAGVEVRIVDEDAANGRVRRLIRIPDLEVNTEAILEAIAVRNPMLDVTSWIIDVNSISHVPERGQMVVPIDLPAVQARIVSDRMGGTLRYTFPTNLSLRDPTVRRQATQQIRHQRIGFRRRRE